MSNNKSVTPIKQTIDAFLLSCKVEGKSYGTIECYADILKDLKLKKLYPL